MHDTALEARVLKGRHRLLEALALQLVVPTVGFVRRGEMREHSVADDPAMEVDAAPEVEHVGIMHADTVHAGLDRHMVPADHAQLDRPLAVRQGELERVDGGHDLMLEQRIDRRDGGLA